MRRRELRENRLTKTQDFWQKLLQPVLHELSKGRTVPELALAITLGTAWGMFPVIGTSTVILLLLTSLLRLNHPAVQLFNYLLYPLQILLLIPFVKIGYMLSPEKFPGVTIETVREIFDESWSDAVISLADILLHGILGWFVVVIPLSFVIYVSFKGILRKYQSVKKNII